MTRKRLVGCVVLAVAAIMSMSGASTKVKKQTMYVFGLAASLTDSVIVLTDVQPIDGFVMPNGFLADRSLYSLQLNNFLLANQQRNNMTCAVYFDKNRSKAEKKYHKLMRRYRDDHAGVLMFLGTDEFQFKSEEWVEEVQEVKSEEAKSDGVKAKKDDAKPKGKPEKAKKDGK